MTGGKEVFGKMLVLQREENEQVMIGNEIVVTVLRIEGGKVRLGFEAPRDVPVHRREVFERIHTGPEDPRHGRRAS